MPIEVIGAGFPRTGTTTLKRSLEQLGFEKTHHMKELIVRPERLHYWLQLEKEGATDWAGLYEGYQATVDFPAYLFYREHMEKYPDAKVILTVRPFDEWYASASATVRKAGPQTVAEKLVMLGRMATSRRIRKAVKCIQFFERLFWEEQFRGRFDDRTFSETVWNNHVVSVKDYVPADRLLIYDVREGWEPLCTFLQLPVPDTPLPHLNKKENFKTMLNELLKGNTV